MSANSHYDMQPSWIKENLSQILLIIAMLILAIGLVFYFLSDVLINSNSTSIDEKVAATPVNAAQPPVEMMTKNWQEDPTEVIEDTPYSVGESDLNGKRVVIAKQELAGLEERYVVDVVDVAKTPSPEQPEMQTQQTNNGQPSISIIKMDEPDESQIDLVDVQEKSIVDQQTESAVPVEAAGKNNILDLILTPTEILLAKPADRFTVKLSELQTLDKLLAFIGQQDLPEEKLYIYQTSRNNQPWFVLIYGEFDSFATAQKAQQGLSDSLSSLLLPIVSYQDIHRDLRLNTRSINSNSINKNSINTDLINND
ncbi:MAG: hypothetical protein WBM99_14380 [Psychromonas sp.]